MGSKTACCLVVFLLILVCQSVFADEYFVAPGGSSSNPGTSSQPFPSVQQAASVVGPGDTVTVRDGTYNEVVSISASGTSSSPITFRAENTHLAKVTGFTIAGDYVEVDGFDVEADTTNYRGIRVVGSVGVVVRNNYVHDCPMPGIDVTMMAEDCEVLDNLVEHCGQVGITVVASGVLVEGNEITDTVQYHEKGDEPGLTGQDADGMRIYGDGHIVRNNLIHDFADPTNTLEVVDPHADCLQTWDEASPTGRPVMTDTIIEGNICKVEHSSGKGVVMSAIHDDVCHDITIRNNVFEIRDQGIEAAYGAFENILVHNNLFVARLNDLPWGTSINMNGVDGYEVYNNIIVDCHAEVRKIQGGTGTVDYNLVWYSDGTDPSGTPQAQANELWGVDPLFVDYSGTPGGDYHLQETSPAIDVGLDIAEVTEDLEGWPRPEGEGYDLGPYEWHVSTDADADSDSDTDTDSDSDSDTDSDTDGGLDSASGNDSSCGCATWKTSLERRKLFSVVSMVF